MQYPMLKLNKYLQPVQKTIQLRYGIIMNLRILSKEEFYQNILRRNQSV